MKRVLLFSLLLFSGYSCGNDAERCEEAAASYASVCQNDGGRSCRAPLYADFCADSPEAGRYADGLDCLAEFSEDGSCRTFSDPSVARDCLQGLDFDISDEVQRVSDAIGDACQRSQDPVEFDPPLPALSSDRLQALEACADQSTSCQAFFDCAVQDALAPFAACS